MKVHEHAAHLTLPDERVAICGDWHNNIGWVRTIARALPILAPDITTILQLGDWGMNPSAVDSEFMDTDIETVLVTLGNHEQWGRITPALAKHAHSSVRVSGKTWLLARPARLTIGGRKVLSLGGAASVDRYSRIEGLTWWPDEAITDEHVAEAISGGPADVMVTHESPASTPVRAVRDMLRTNPHRFPDDALVDSAASRARVTSVWDATHPALLLHGHMHLPGGGAMKDGRRVASMGRDVQQGNLGFLNMKTLRMETPSLQRIRAAAET